MEGIIKFINLIHGKLRTPKNIRFNQLIEFINFKYNLNIVKSELDTSPILNNSWFSGMVEADGHFGVKYRTAKSKSESRKRSISEAAKPSAYII